MRYNRRELAEIFEGLSGIIRQLRNSLRFNCQMRNGELFKSLSHSRSGKHGRFGHVIEQEELLYTIVYISSDFEPQPSSVSNMLESFNITKTRIRQS